MSRIGIRMLIASLRVSLISELDRASNPVAAGPATNLRSWELKHHGSLESSPLMNASASRHSNTAAGEEVAGVHLMQEQSLSPAATTGAKNM
ncbi:hypothetical protein EJB05_44953, partial [Eragrostis curvula]